MTVNLNDPRRADARGWGRMWAPGSSPRTDMVPLQVAGISFVGGVHPKLHDLFEILWTEAVARGYELKRNPTQTWGFAWRPVRGTEHYSAANGHPGGPVPSNHSSGTAADANSAFNYLGRADGGDVPQWLVAMFNRYGFRWGGDYSGRKDAMHWEAMFEVSQVDELTRQAEEELMGLTAEEKATLARAEAFLDALTGPLKPGKDAATAKGAGERVAKSTLITERATDPDGVEH